MKWKLLKAWLLIKLRQASTTGGIAIGLVWLAKQLGWEIPPEYMPSLESIGMAVATILLIFLRESGETDAMQDARHQIEVDAHEHRQETPAAVPDPAEFRTGGVRVDRTVHPVAGRRTERQDHGGFNG